MLSSPPYAGTYDYAEHHDVRFRWLGLPRADFDRAQIGARKGGPVSSDKRWPGDRRRWLGEMGRVVRPGGSVVLVVGDGVVGGEPEDAAAAIAAAAVQAGLVLLGGASQARPPRDRRLAAIFAEHPRREHALILRARMNAPGRYSGTRLVGLWPSLASRMRRTNELPAAVHMACSSCDVARPADGRRRPRARRRGG